MAFSCMKNNEPIHSFTYSLKNWIALKEDKVSIFKMTCCGNQAILKTSKLSTQFFAHKVKPKNTECSTGSETVEHMHIKYLVSKTLFECGWRVEIEKRGISSKNEKWIADIYAEKGKAKIAIEVQWSRQSFIETKHRQQVYKDSDIRCAWLLRSGSVKDRNAIVGDFMHRTESVPVFSIYKNKKDSDSTYQVYNVSKANSERGLIFNPLESTDLVLDDFVRKLVSGKIKFRPKYSPISQLVLSIVKQQCWACHRVTNTVVRVRFINTLYGFDYEYSHDSKFVDECNKETVDLINMSFSQAYHFVPLRSRYSKTEGRNYIANSCIHCDALMGRFFDKQAYWRTSYDPDTLIETSKLVIPRYDNMTDIKTRLSKKEIDFEVGRWVLIDTP